MPLSVSLASLLLKLTCCSSRALHMRNWYSIDIAHAQLVLNRDSDNIFSFIQQMDGLIAGGREGGHFTRRKQMNGILQMTVEPIYATTHTTTSNIGFIYFA